MGSEVWNEPWMQRGVAIAIACLLDRLIGDPWGWPHPVRVMGWAIARGRDATFRYVPAPWGQRLAGMAIAIALVGGSGWLGWWFPSTLAWAFGGNVWHDGMALAIESVLLASCLAGRSLRDAAFAVLDPLERGDLAASRRTLSLYVGRDTENLMEAEILRAILETVSENTTDGVIAPLFYALLGGAPLALAYKAASTLDSMLGFRNLPYTWIGWFPAKFEDAATWLPCRLTVGLVALLSGCPRRVWRLCRRDASLDPSPNSGWSECAFAAALGVQLGGENRYRGVVKHKPKLGDRDREITPDIIREAVQLMAACALGLLGCGLMAAIAIAWLTR